MTPRALLPESIRFALGLAWAPWLDSAEYAIRCFELWGLPTETGSAPASPPESLPA